MGKSLWSNKYEAHLRDCSSIPNEDPAATSLQKSVIVHFFYNLCKATQTFHPSLITQAIVQFRPKSIH